MANKIFREENNSKSIQNLAKFVVKENFLHHTHVDCFEAYVDNIFEIYNEEMQFGENSKIYTCKDEKGKLEGVIRILKWNYLDILPIQKLFNINPMEVIGTHELKNIYHIGRFAIKSNLGGVLLFKKLILNTLKSMYNDIYSVAFAECDKKLMVTLVRLGIKVRIIGESIDYLGSETIPICMYHEDIIEFYEENKHLLESNNTFYQMPSIFSLTVLS